MSPSLSHEVTRLLHRWSEGDACALDQLTPLVYQELRVLAESYLRHERPDHTLQPTALIHEAYLRLVEQDQKFESRRHFYGVAAHLMRMILVDHARARGAVKRGADQTRLSLETIDLAAPERAADLVALDQALERLAGFDARKSRAVELRYFGGMSVEEVAAELEISVATLRRELRLAENWLYRELTRL
jgi:RNA polymerase sigma factor (TIGR02999 family)